MVHKKFHVTQKTEDYRVEVFLDFLSSTCSKIKLIKLQLHDAIYRLRFYSNSLIHILSLSNSHNNVASIQKNRDDKSHRGIIT